MKYKHKKKFVWQGYVKLSNLNEKKGAKYMSQKDMNTHEMDAVTYYTKEDNAVVAEKFQFSDMWKKDDWLSIWIGFVIIAIGWLSIVQGFTFKSTKVGTWGGGGKSLGEVLTMDMWLGVLFTFAVFAVLFGIGNKMMGKDPIKWVIGFAGVFGLSLLAYGLAAQATMKNYLEYAFWALLIGILLCNTIRTPKWMQPAIQTEFYIKTGLVIMGAEVLFSNIAKFGLYGLAISWTVCPIVIIFMWLFGTKFLKMANKSMVMVIAAATSVCGTSAAIAAAAACKAKKEDLTFAIGLSLMFTVVMMVGMPLFIKAVGLSDMVGGAWIGGTVDSTGAVVLAGEALGDVGAQVAALVKMIQNILIGFIAFAIAIFFATRVDRGSEATIGLSEIWHRFPKFILGFVAASCLFSFIVEPTYGTETTSAILKTFSGFKGWCFCLAFMSIGLETNFKDMAEQMAGGKPMILYVVGQVFSLALSLLVCWILLSGVFFPIPDLAMYS